MNMRQVAACVAHINTLIDERTPLERPLTPLEHAGISQLKASIWFLHQAESTFGVVDAFYFNTVLEHKPEGK
jgi:hypothetical protein